MSVETLTIEDLAAAVAERLAQKQAPAETAMTMREFATLYIERHAKPHKKSWASDETRLRLHILPAFGELPLTAIKPAAILDFQAQLCTNVGKYAANRSTEQMHTMLKLARQWGHFPEDRRLPTEGIKAFAEPSRERFVSHDEIDRLADSIKQVRAPHLRSLFWLYLLIGLRRDELRMLKWSNVDLERRELNLSGEFTKSGRSICVGLSPEACMLFDLLPRNSTYVFAAGGRPQPVSKTTVWKCFDRVRRRANMNDIRIHDLRRTVGSWLAQSGASLALIGKVLNHSGTRAAEVYARFANTDVTQALEKHALSLSAFLPVKPSEECRAKRDTDEPASREQNEPSEPLPLASVIAKRSMPSFARSVSQVRAPHLRAFFWLYMLTGLSQTELLNLRWTDVNFDDSSVCVREDSSHSRKAFKQFLSSAALDELNSLPKHSLYIFSPPGKALPVSYPTVRDCWEKVCRRANLNLELKAMRRTSIELLAENGASKALIDRLLNLSSPEFSDDVVREALEQLSVKLRTLAKHTSVEKLA